MTYPTGNCIYLIGDDKMPGTYKIGKTKNINIRKKAYHTSLPSEKIFHISYTNNMDKAEKIIFAQLKDYRISKRKEWFQCDNVEYLIEVIDKIASKTITNKIIVDYPCVFCGDFTKYTSCSKCKFCINCEKYTPTGLNEFFVCRSCIKVCDVRKCENKLIDIGLAKTCSLCNVVFPNYMFNINGINICKKCW